MKLVIEFGVVKGTAQLLISNTCVMVLESAGNANYAIMLYLDFLDVCTVFCNFHCIFYMCFYFAAFWRNKRLITIV